MKVKFAVLFLILLFAGVFFVLALLTVEFRITSVAQIKTIGVEAYEDANLTTLLTSIDWGTVEPGENVTRPIWVKSVSNAPIFLWLSTESWVPLNATSYISLFWDYDGSLLQPSDYTPLVLTLAVSENVTGITSFSFDVVISGEG